MVRGQWRQVLTDTALQRSSHVVSVVNRKAYVFGGELIPRQPRDNELFQVFLDGEGTSVEISNLASAPSPRVGSASATLGSKLYIFSGRGGIAMKPVDENGGLHEYDTASSSWKTINTVDSSSTYPPARSYHCMTSDGDSTLFLHAGCPETGRLADLWSFEVHGRRWAQLPEAPGPQRGGTSVAYLDAKLYRMNGFDGKQEQGGYVDIYDIKSKTWSSEKFSADGIGGPEARSVSVLLPLHVNGKPKLLTMFGERDPSSLGHAGAGKMLGDWWTYDVTSREWEKGVNTGTDVPAPRGWFDADVVDNNQVVVVGGLDENNERLDDVWVLSIS